jgi:hypothetical protein
MPERRPSGIDAVWLFERLVGGGRLGGGRLGSSGCFSICRHDNIDEQLLPRVIIHVMRQI